MHSGHAEGLAHGRDATVALEPTDLDEGMVH
jgi:hypothetical protein